MRVVVYSSLPICRPWDLWKFRPVPLYGLWDLEELSTMRSEGRVVLYSYPPYLLDLRLEKIPSFPLLCIGFLNLGELSIEKSEVRVIVCSSLPIFRPRNLWEFRPVPLYRLWDLEKWSTMQSKGRVVLYSYLLIFWPWDIKKFRVLLVNVFALKN